MREKTCNSLNNNDVSLLPPAFEESYKYDLSESDKIVVDVQRIDYCDVEAIANLYL